MSETNDTNRVVFSCANFGSCGAIKFTKDKLCIISPTVPNANDYVNRSNERQNRDMRELGAKAKIASDLTHK